MNCGVIQMKTMEDFMFLSKNVARALCVVGGLFIASSGYAAAEQKAEGSAKKSEKKDSKKDKSAVKEVKKVNPNAVVVTMVTNKGTIKIELDKEKAPISVENFLGYVKSGHYSKTVFHRVIDKFMIQGGGFDEKMTQKSTKAPIKTEASNGLKNLRGTLAMARTNDVNSATAQFFINLVDNSFLDYPNNGGYTVFGKVTEGMNVVDDIATTKTGSFGMHSDVPVKPVVIESANVD
jgi:cyclophilin family peptidyl-prolyl cis-trans isomerase